MRKPLGSSINEENLMIGKRFRNWHAKPDRKAGAEIAFQVWRCRWEKDVRFLGLENITFEEWNTGTSNPQRYRDDVARWCLKNLADCVAQYLPSDVSEEDGHHIVDQVWRALHSRGWLRTYTWYEDVSSRKREQIYCSPCDVTYRFQATGKKYEAPEVDVTQLQAIATTVADLMRGRKEGMPNKAAEGDA
jgi:hypothetical protein